jgi:hypothetical protein
MAKQPIGRSAPLEMANGLCDDDCSGYRQEPRAGHLWPGELARECKRRYVELGEEMKTLNYKAPRYLEVLGEMDRIWAGLSELEREEIEGLLIAIDEVERTGKGYPPAEAVEESE